LFPHHNGNLTRMFSSNRWNRLRYTYWAPVYDSIARFSAPRARAMALLAASAGERVLLAGCGTGLDLPFVPPGVRVEAVDLTAAMLDRARPKRTRDTGVVLMDVHQLAFPDATFDAVVLNLILAVVAHPTTALAEAARVLRPGGRIVVFDKFLGDDELPSWRRRLLNAVVRVLFTEMNRRFGDILRSSGAPLRVVHEEPAMFGGMYRILLLNLEP
jgi:ubiquinone/menaquinone biosynthesis C-methylase UbiE